MRLIDADELVKVIENLMYEPDSVQYIWSSDVLCAIRSAPTVQPAPVVHGRWIEVAMDIVCSNCKAAYDAEVANLYRGEQDLVHYGGFEHCPHCGAKMDGGEVVT